MVNNENFSKVPILILANKKDLVGSLEREELISCLGLYEKMYPTVSINDQQELLQIYKPMAVAFTE